MMFKRKKRGLVSGEARVQFLACQPAAEELLRQGHSVAAVYRTLLAKGDVSMTQRAFLANVKKFCPGVAVGSRRAPPWGGTAGRAPSAQARPAGLTQGQDMSNELLEGLKELCRGTSLENPRD